MLRPADGIYGLQASLLKTLASPRRLEIVHFLGENGTVEVRKLAEHFGSTQPAISQHLAAPRVRSMPNSVAKNLLIFPWESPASLLRWTMAAWASGPSWLAQHPRASEVCSGCRPCTRRWQPVQCPMCT